MKIIIKQSEMKKTILIFILNKQSKYLHSIQQSRETLS